MLAMPAASAAPSELPAAGDKSAVPSPTPIHWAYVKPRQAPLPSVTRLAWPKNAIDHFVLARLKSEGLSPSPVAGPYRLTRRVALDLTGLPPAPEDADTLAKGASDKDYDAFVERLLASPHYGEQRAREWMDLARYADTMGYEKDLRRTMWPYRDWAVRAYNADMPFDQFTREQIAGDLLSDATPDQILATAFHRNTMTNTEGGTDDEEFRVAAVVDRINTTFEVWMGTTMSCAQCHDHKYDPFKQREYYQIFAFFNQTEDADRQDEKPKMRILTEDQRTEMDRLRAYLDQLSKQMKAPSEALDTAQREWERREQKGSTQWQPLKPFAVSGKSKAVLTVQKDASVLVSGDRPGKDVYVVQARTDLKRITALRLEVLPDKKLPGKGPGRAGSGNFVLNELSVVAAPINNQSAPAGRTGRYVRIDLPGKKRTLSLAEVQVFSNGKNVAAQGKATQSSTKYKSVPARAIDGNTNGNHDKAKSTTHTQKEDNPWWQVDLKAVYSIDRIVVWNRTDGKLKSRLNGARVSILDAERQSVWEKTIKKAPAKSVALHTNGGTTLKLARATADFSQKEYPVALAIDGNEGAKSGWAISPQTGKRHVAVFEIEAGKLWAGGAKLEIRLVQSYGSGHTLGRFRLSVTDAPPPIAVIPAATRMILAIPPEKRSKAQRTKVRTLYRSRAPGLDALRQDMTQTQKKIRDLEKRSPEVPIMRERPSDKRRQTHILVRGSFLDPGEGVEDGVPAALHPFPKDAPRNRLGLSAWLTHRDNPLTARVLVNRYWERFFGRGLVETSNDFGTRGAKPSHPELLDWLAVEFMERGWSIKWLCRTIVTSATYRQSSIVTRELRRRDPGNRFLARGARFRLPAESIRDQALAVSGLLSRKLYGPPVMPPQPDNLWQIVFSGDKWKTSTGEDRFRRGFYTFWRRTMPYPLMTTFDAPSREVCTILRIRTNTPLQALLTLNDPQFIEAAQALARRVLREGNATPRERVVRAFRLCLIRPPREAEIKPLLGLLSGEHERYQADLEQAKFMATEPIGAIPEGMDTAELAALTVVCNVLLNLSETLTRG